MTSVALITGAANGIGLATLKALRAAGWQVIGIDRDPRAVAALRALYTADPKVRIIEQDLSHHDALPEVLHGAIAHFGRIDALVNSAAIIGGTLDLLSIEGEEWDRVYRLNVKTPFLLLQLFAAHAISRGGGGRVVNVTSASAFRAFDTRPAYGSSKAALGALTRIAAAQLGPHDINVNAVAPGITNTPGAGSVRGSGLDVMQAKVSSGPQENFFHRMSEPEDVAATIKFLLSAESRQITGQTIHVSAGAVTT